MGASRRFQDQIDVAPELRQPYGRDRELEAFRLWLGAPAQGQVLYLRGAGGVGKSTLLGAMRGAVEQAGGRAVRIDLRDLPAQASAVEEGLALALDRLGSQGGVVLLDSFDAHARLEPWYRERLRNQPRADVRWVIAGRRTLQRAWLHGPEAVAGLTVQRLTGLSPEVSRELLQGLPEPLADYLVELCLGHPGALDAALQLAGAGAQRPEQFIDQVYGAVVDASDVVPSAAHHEALRVAALLPALDPRLLAAALDTPEAARLYDWLAGHSAVHAADGRLALDPLLAQALRHDYHLSQPEAYARRILQLGRLLAERLERANRPEARQAAVEGLLRLGYESSELPSPALHVEGLPVEVARVALARELPDAALAISFDGRVQCQLVRSGHGELLGCVLISDPRSRGLRRHSEARAIRAFLGERAVSAAERVLLLEPVLFGHGASRAVAGRAVFEVVARLLHTDRRLSVGLVACAPDDLGLPALAAQLGMLEPLASATEPPAEHGTTLWFCDHAKRGAAACLYSRLVDRHAPRGQTVAAMPA
jgi:energy-coupling factor transporter ATP-binding protein EcfA2